MSRSPESFLLEVDYWRAVLEEGKGLNVALAEVASPLVALGMDTVLLAVAPGCSDAAQMEAKARRSLDALAEARAHLQALIELVSGRIAAMDRERAEEYA